MAHLIRLLGPWEVAAVARYAQQANGSWTLSGENLPAPGRVKLPGSWNESLGADFRGVARFTRRFHRPTGLRTGDRVWLTVDLSAQGSKVTLNGEELTPANQAGSTTPLRFEISERLLDSNLLSIEISNAAGLPAPIIRFVALEIDAA